MVGSFFRHGSNTVLVVIALALVVLFATHVLAFAPMSPAAVATGALVFFTSEYTTHRFMFHAPPQKNAFILRLQHRLHYDHHVAPDELGLLFLPVWFVIPVAALTFAIFFAVTRNLSVSAAMVLGAVLGLFYYEWVHYVAHIPFVPKTPFGRWIKKYHLWHHFKNERMWFGVTNPSADAARKEKKRPGDGSRGLFSVCR